MFHCNFLDNCYQYLDIEWGEIPITSQSWMPQDQQSSCLLTHWMHSILQLAGFGNSHWQQKILDQYRHIYLLSTMLHVFFLTNQKSLLFNVASNACFTILIHRKLWSKILLKWKLTSLGISLVIQWLTLHFSIQEVQLQSLVGGLSYMPHGPKKKRKENPEHKQKQYCNKLNKDFKKKWSTPKKSSN